MYRVLLRVVLRPSILDTEGKAVRSALENLGQSEVQQVRIGKSVELLIEAGDAEAAEGVARKAAETLLANPVMEDFSVVSVEEAGAIA